MIRRIAHLCISSTDLVQTERFYSVLGFKRKFDFVRNGQCIGFYLQVSEFGFVEVFQKEHVTRAGTPPIDHVCFEVESIDEISKALKQAGIDVTEKLLGADHSWQCWTADPDGVRIEFHEYTGESSQLTGAVCQLS